MTSLQSGTWLAEIQGIPSIQASGDRQSLGRQRHHPQASQKEKTEERQMAVRHVADLMAEDGGDLGRAQGLDQGVGQKNIAKPGQDAGDTGVDHDLPGVPDQKIGEPKAHAPRCALQPAAQRSVRQRASGPGQPHEQRRNQQDQTRQRRKLNRLGQRAAMPLGPEPREQVLTHDEDQDHGQDQAHRLARLEPEINGQSRVESRIVQRPFGEKQPGPEEELHHNERRQDCQVVDQKKVPKPHVARTSFDQPTT